MANHLNTFRTPWMLKTVSYDGQLARTLTRLTGRCLMIASADWLLCDVLPYMNPNTM